MDFISVINRNKLQSIPKDYKVSILVTDTQKVNMRGPFHMIYFLMHSIENQELRCFLCLSKYCGSVSCRELQTYYLMKAETNGKQDIDLDQ